MQYIYVGGGSNGTDNMYRSTDYGNTWAIVSPNTGCWQGLICSSDGSTVYVYEFMNKNFWKSTNYGASGSWSIISGISGSGQYQNSLCIGSSDASVVYLLYTGTSGYISTNSGASWSALTLPYGLGMPVCNSTGQHVFLKSDEFSALLIDARGLWPIAR
jgi:hypothetical protein